MNSSLRALVKGPITLCKCLTDLWLILVWTGFSFWRAGFASVYLPTSRIRSKGFRAAFIVVVYFIHLSLSSSNTFFVDKFFFTLLRFETHSKDRSQNWLPFFFFFRFNPNPYPDIDPAYALNFPNKDQTIPGWVLMFACFILPIFLFGFAQRTYRQWLGLGCSGKWRGFGEIYHKGRMEAADEGEDKLLMALVIG